MTPRRIWRGVFLTLMTFWAWLMIALGLQLVLEWSGRAPQWENVFLILGGVLLAMGQFACTLVADRLFPRAHAALSAIYGFAACLAVPTILVLGVMLT